MSTPVKGQLHMLWPDGRRPGADDLRLPDGYLQRAADPDDVAAFRTLMARVELGQWDDAELARIRATVVPGGWQVVVHDPDGTLVATGMAQFNPIGGLYPDGYEVGWIAADPDHAGRGLGRAVTAAATLRLVDIGAARIYMRSDDFRLPAVKTYLRLGFVPHLYSSEMPARWEAVCERLGWPFTPAAWPAADGVPI